MKAKSFLTILVYAIAFCILAWILFSFIDINVNNVTNGTDSAWNFFNLFS